MIFHLPTRDLLLNPQTASPNGSLYPTFVVYFIDHRRPIFLIQRTISFFFYKDNSINWKNKILIKKNSKFIFPIDVFYEIQFRYSNFRFLYNYFSKEFHLSAYHQPIIYVTLYIEQVRHEREIQNREYL